MMNNLLDKLRSDRGATDPVLSILAVSGTMLLSIIVFATLITTFNFIGNYTTEQSRSALLTTAGKAWAMDANNASQAFLVSDTNAVFYELPGRSPGVYQERGDGGFRTDCRKSVWTLTGGVLTNEVSYFNNEHCDLGTDPGTASASANTIRVDGFPENASFVAENSAGRDLRYDADGREVGLTTTNNALKSKNTRDDYWRDYEWEWSQPAVVSLSTKSGASATIDLPVSGKRPADISGRTWIAPTQQGDTLTDPEENPEQTQYNPGPVNNLRVERSATTGDIFGSVREGIQITWDAVSCGPFTTEYTVRYNPTTAGVDRQSHVFTAFGAFSPVHMAEVPNGAVGEVTVEAACPRTVSNHTSTGAENYTQPIPAPILTAVEDGDRPHEHTLTWGAVSSLPSMTYRAEFSKNGAAFAPQNIATPNPTRETTQLLTFDTGSTYGQSHRYRVIAVLATVESDPSNIATIQTPWPPIAPPTITGTPTTDLTGYRTTISSITCPAGTNGQYSQRMRLGENVWSSWRAFSTTRYVNWTSTQIPEGARIQVQGQVRCVYNASQFSPTQQAQNTAEWIRPIVTVPTPPIIDFTDGGDDTDPIRTEFEVTGCPASTYVEYRYRYRINETGEFNTFSSWSKDNHALIVMLRGQNIEVEAQARCASDYTKGPESPTGEGEWVRPIPPPPALTGVTTDDGGTAEPINNRIIHDAAVCPAGTRPEYRYRQTTPAPTGAWTAWLDKGTNLNHNIDVAWGRQYVWEVQARCISDYAQSDPGPARNTTWLTNLPKPDRDPLITVPARVEMDSAYNVTVSQTAICKPGTEVRYILRGENFNTAPWFDAGTGWTKFETDNRAEPQRWDWPNVEHVAPKARTTDYNVEYSIIAVCDGPDRDASPDNPLEAAKTGPVRTVAVYPKIQNTPTAVNLSLADGGSGTNTSGVATYSAPGCLPTQWPEFRTRYVVQTAASAGTPLSAWSAWGGSLTAANPNGNQQQVVPMDQGHRLDFQVQARCIDPYVRDAWDNKGDIVTSSLQNHVRSVENPTGLLLEQPFWMDMPHGTTRNVRMSAACVAPTSVQFLWRNDGAGGNMGVWQGWFGVNDGSSYNGRPTFSTSAITATWGSWYGSSVQARCVGVFANSDNVFQQTPGVRTQLPPAPSGVSMSVSGGNQQPYGGSRFVNNGYNASASWTATVYGSCPGGTYTSIGWANNATQGASSYVNSSSSGRRWGNNATVYFGSHSVTCIGSESGAAGPSVGTGQQSRSIQVYADYSYPPIPSTPTGASLRCNNDFGTRCRTGAEASTALSYTASWNAMTYATSYYATLSFTERGITSSVNTTTGSTVWNQYMASATEGSSCLPSRMTVRAQSGYGNSGTASAGTCGG